MPIRPDKANSNVVKTLKLVASSSHDGVPFPFKIEKGNLPIRYFISMDSLSVVLTPLSSL
jgi:hypothetical protein